MAELELGNSTLCEMQEPAATKLLGKLGGTYDDVVRINTNTRIMTIAIQCREYIVHKPRYGITGSAYVIADGEALDLKNS